MNIGFKGDRICGFFFLKTVIHRTTGFLASCMQKHRILFLECNIHYWAEENGVTSVFVLFEVSHRSPDGFQTTGILCLHSPLLQPPLAFSRPTIGGDWASESLLAVHKDLQAHGEALA